MADFRVTGEVTLDISDVLSGFAEIDAAMRAVTDHLDIDIDVDALEAMAILEEIDHQVSSLDGDTINIDVDVDKRGIDELATSAENARGSIGGGGMGGGGLISAVLALGTALIPLSAVAVGVGGAIVSSMSVASVGVGAFAALAIPTIKQVIEGNKSLKKAADAVANADSHEKLVKALAAQKKAVEDLDPAIKNAILQFRGLEESWLNMAEVMKPQVLDIFSKAIGVANQLLQEMLPMARGAAFGIEDLITRASKGIKTDNWQKFFDYVSKNAGSFISVWGQVFGNLLTGFANIIVAFDPLTRTVNNGLLGMSQNFKKWSETLDQNQGFQRFLSYVQEKGPEVWQILKNVARGLLDLGIALEPVGSQVLDLIGKVTAMVTKFKETNPQLFDMAVKIGLVAAAVAPFAGALTTLLGPLKSFAGILAGGMTARLAALLGPFAALAGPILAVAAAITAIGVALALTNTHTATAAGMWNSLKTAWEAIKQTALEIWANIQKLYTLLQDFGTIEDFQQGIKNLADAFVALLPIIKIAAIILGVTLVSAIAAFGIAFNQVSAVIKVGAEIIGAVVKKIADFFQWLFDFLVGHSIVPDMINAIISWFSKLLTFFPSLLGRVLGFFTSYWTRIYSYVSGRLSAIYSIISSKMSSAGSFVSSKLSAIAGYFSSKLQQAWSYVSSRFSSIVSTVSSKLESMKSTISGKLNDVVGFFRNLPGRITGALGNLGGLLLGAGKSLIQGLINGILSKLPDVGGAMSKVGGFIRDHMPGSPVKEGPLTAWNDGSPGAALIGLIADGLIGRINELESALDKVGGAVVRHTLPMPPLTGPMHVKNPNPLTGPSYNPGAPSNLQQMPDGRTTQIGVYVAQGAIQINGSGSPAKTADAVLSRLTRVSRFGLFQGPSGTNLR